MLEHGPSAASRIAPDYRADYIFSGSRSAEYQHTPMGVKRDRSLLSDRLCLTEDCRENFSSALESRFMLLIAKFVERPYTQCNVYCE